MTATRGPVLARRAMGVAMLVLATLVVAVGGASIDTAQAQTAPAPDNDIVLTSQTAWVGGGGTANPDLHLGLKITAANPATTTLQVSVFRRLVNRSDFDASLDGKIRTALTHAFDQVALNKLTVDASGAYQVDVPVNPLVEEPGVGLLSIQVPGVYPVQVVTLDRSNRILARLTTHLLFTGKATAKQTPLDVALLAPVHAAPAIGKDGKPAKVTEAKSAALASEADAVAAHPGVPVTLTPTPETLESLASGTEVDKASLAKLAGAVQGTADRVVAAPYVSVNVATMNAVGLDAELSAQITRGSAVIGSTLHVTPSLQTWVEQGALSVSGIDDLYGRGVRQLVVDGTSLSPVAGTATAATLAQPFELAGRDGHRVAALATDAGLQAHFTNGPTQVLAAHQLLADLAMIQQEAPNATRGVVVAIPDTWPVNPEFLSAVLDGLQGSSMVTPVTAGRLFTDVGPAQAQRGATLVRSLAFPQPPGPTISDAPAIRAARAAITGVASVAPAEPALSDDAQRQLLIAQSDDVADRQRPAQVAAATKLVTDVRDLVHLPANESITLTARKGSIPITLASNAPYTARVRIRLSSQKLAFHGIGVVGGSCQPGASAETCVVDLHNENTTLKVPVQARTAGVYPLKIELMSPDGSVALATAQYTVRSTAASGVGIVLSIGAALLLVLWWGRDLHHGRRARQLVPAAPPVEPEPVDDDPYDDDLRPPWPPPPRAPPQPSRQPRRGATVTARRPPAVVTPLRRGGLITEPVTRVDDSGRPSALVEPVGSVPPTAATPGPVVPAVPVARAAVPSGPGDSLAGEPGLGLPPVPPPRRPPGGGPLMGANGNEAPASFSRNTAVVAGGTLLSRLTGFGRVLALVWAFHVTRLGDVYNIANTVPNILYDLVLGGVLSATLIPVFVDYMGRDDEDEGWRAISAICTMIAATLLVLSAVFWLLVPLIIRFYLIFNHTAGAADERAIGITLLRLFVPQLALLGGIAVTTALLNARRRFGVAAFSPVLNNLICIAAIVITRLVAGSLDLASFRHDRTALLILGLGTTAGYLVQFIVQVPAIMRGRYRLHPVWQPRHPAVRTVLRLSLWTFGAVLANQVAFNLVLIIAGKKSGDVVVFTTAYQFFQLPYAIFAVSIAAVVTPDLSDRWAKGDVAGFRRQMAGGLRLTLALLIPAAVGYVALAQPFLTLIFHHGSFSAHDAHKIGTVVALFAVGLPGFSAYLLLMRAYQAMQDTKSMFWLYVVENGVTIVLATALYPAFGVGGLALGWVLAYTVGAIVAFFNLRKRTGGLEGRATARTLARVAVATAVMLVAVLALRLVLGGGGSDRRLIVVVGAGAIVGAVVYVVVCRFLGVSELDVILRRRRKHGAHWASRRA